MPNIPGSTRHGEKMYPNWKKFRDESFERFRVAEYSYDSYVYSAQAGKK